jgi:restriction system protein
MQPRKHHRFMRKISPLRNGSVLIVDDDVAFVRQLVTAFKTANFNNPVLTFSTVSSAISFLKQRRAFSHEPTDLPSVLMLVDSQPSKNGHESLILKVRSNEALNGLGVIALSHSEDAAHIERCYELGFNSYMLKPLTEDDALGLVRMISGFWLSCVAKVLNEEVQQSDENPSILMGLSVHAIIQPFGANEDGELIKALSIPWKAVIRELKGDWNLSYQISPRTWEGIIAAAFDHAGYDEVILTPASGDHGRDVIAIKNGVGAIKIIGSVKINKPGNLVRYDDIRSLAGVLLGDPQASKGILTTTSDFPPNISSDPFLSPLMPYRLELMNGQQLKTWLESLI